MNYELIWKKTGAQAAKLFPTAVTVTKVRQPATQAEFFIVGTPMHRIERTETLLIGEKVTGIPCSDSEKFSAMMGNTLWIKHRLYAADTGQELDVIGQIQELAEMATGE